MANHTQSIEVRRVLDKGLKSLADEEAPDEIRLKAKPLIDQAERENTMTTAQIRVARIYMIVVERLRSPGGKNQTLMAHFTRGFGYCAELCRVDEGLIPGTAQRAQGRVCLQWRANDIVLNYHQEAVQRQRQTFSID